ncbi:MAG: VOC family protein [Actinomycetota bacterium]|nr:VOC family protein [Actinomycetota bacterium]
MLDHLAIQAADVDAAAAFYLDVFSPLGFREAMRYEGGEGAVVGFSGVDGFPHFWLGPQVDPGTRPIHLAFTAPSREAVDQVHAKAIERGAEILHEARVWPEYHDRYYGVFFRDPDGNNVEAVCHI